MKHFSIKDKKNKYGHYTYCFNYESAGFIMTYDWLRSLKQPRKMLIDPDGDKTDLFSASIVVIQHNYFNIG